MIARRWSVILSACLLQYPIPLYTEHNRVLRYFNLASPSACEGTLLDQCPSRPFTPNQVAIVVSLLDSWLLILNIFLAFKL